MNIEQEKSLALAELMGWKTAFNGRCLDTEGVPNGLQGLALKPYSEVPLGLAQFATILLKAIKEEGILNPQKSILDSMLKDCGKWKGEWNED